MKRVLLVLVILGSFSSPLLARQWTSRAGGFSVEAELLDVREGNAILKKADGSELSVPVNKLSLADVRYLEETLQAADSRLTGKAETRGEKAAAETPAQPVDPALLSKLHYAWKPGQSFVYRATLAIDEGGFTRNLKGDITYKVHATTDDGLELKVTGGVVPGEDSSPNLVVLGRGPHARLHISKGPAPKEYEGILVVDPQGQVVRIDGNRQLPALLGEQASLILEPLSASPKASWSAGGETGVSVVVTIHGLQRFFAHPPMDSKIQVFEGTDATEKVTYTVDSADEKLVTVAKHYELTTSSLINGKPRIEATGNGHWKFDVQRGVPSSMDYTLRITTRERNSTEETPVRLSYRLLSEDEQARAAKEAEEAKQKEDEAQREKERPLTSEEVAKLLPELKSSNRARVEEALKRLAEKEPATPNPEVAAALESLVQSSENPFQRMNAIKALKNWSRPESVPVVLKALSDQMPGVQSIALEILIQYNPEKYTSAIALLLPERQTRAAALKALKAIGPPAEAAAWPYFEKAEKGERPDDWLRSDLCKLLGDIGTEKSIPALEKLSNDSNWMVSGAAKKALESIRLRQQLTPKEN